MNTDNRKILKLRIEKLQGEVKDFHPLLDALFNKMESIEHVSYTHGPHERGADFVLTTISPEFGDTEYIGVIAKVGKITSNITSIDEQIKECMEKRLTSNGRKEVYLSEIWITANGNISERAREKIYARYRSHKIRFIPLEQLVDLTEKYVPDFGTNLSIRDSTYLSRELEKAEQRDTQFSLLPISARGLYVEPEIIIREKSEFDGPLGSKKSVAFFEEVRNQTALLVEAPMGGGKSSLLNRTVTYFSNPEIYSNDRILPVYMTCAQLFEDADFTLSDLLKRISEENDLTDDADRTTLVIIDGLDEVYDDQPHQVDKLMAAIDEATSESCDLKVKIILATRGIADERLEARLDKRFKRYEIRPLTLNKILVFVSEICASLNLQSRLIEDLKESILVKHLPKTPIAAIILAKLISDGAEEVPANLTELYSQYCELALGRWDIDKGLSSLKEYEASDSIVSNIAAFILDNNLQHIAYSEAQDHFRHFLSERHLSIDPSDLFDKVLKRSDILVHREDLNVIAFKHRSFAEFFYAKNLTRRDEVEISDKIFHPYWANAYFFYVGLKKDCPDLLKKICDLGVDNIEGARLSKLLHLGEFLLAGYKSPYHAIEYGVKTAFIGARSYYLDVRDSRVESFFRQVPPVHLLAIFRSILQDSYSYPFFSRAIESAVKQLVDKGSFEEEDLYELLMYDATRGELGTVVALEGLVKAGKKKDILPIPIQSIICSPNSMKSDPSRMLRPLEKRMRKQLKNSSHFQKALYDSAHRSFDGKMEIASDGKRLSPTSKHSTGRQSGKRR